MDCDLCGKAFTEKNGCVCTVCARNSTYPLRIAQATTLLEKEKLGKHVETILRGSSAQDSESSLEPTLALGTSTGGTLIDRYESAKRIDVDRIRAETDEGRYRVEQITEQAAILQREIDELKRKRYAKQAANAKKTSELAEASHGLAARRFKELDRVQYEISERNKKWDAVYDNGAKNRAYLCKETADLLGLKHSKRRTKDGSVKDVYHLGTIKIFDLRDMYTVQPDLLSGSLSNVAMLLVRIAHYLSLRLPLEVTLPHKDYPRPTIFSQANSYLGREVPFPATTPSASTSNSPSASRNLDQDSHPRPRALYIDRPLPQLYKEDSNAYKMFIEGACLLAWDIAWVCKSQGMPIDYSNWEEICNVGRNLYQLLIIQPPYIPSPFKKDPTPPPLSRNPSQRALQSPAVALPRTSLGQQSHGTSHSFLKVEGNSRAWKIAPVHKVIDHVKASLVAEMQGAEWEVLKEDEWTGMDAEMKEEPIVIGQQGRGPASVGGRSIMSTIEEDVMSVRSGGTERTGGSNGWMKLKSRNGEVLPK